MLYQFYDKLKGNDSFDAYSILQELHLEHIENATTQNVLTVYEKLKPLNDKYFDYINKYSTCMNKLTDDEQ